MAITVCGNCIEFGGSYTMCNTPTGFSFNGAIKANGRLGTELATISPMQGTNCGFHSGGCCFPPFDLSTRIESYPFSVDAGSTCVGTLHDPCTISSGGMSSQENGYHAHFFGSTRDVSKFPFASVGTATDASELNVKIDRGASHSSPTDGYASGGVDPVSVCAVIEKFPFAADNPATDIGELCCSVSQAAGHSSLTHGYTSAGLLSGPGTHVNVIQMFPFAVDENAVLVTADGLSAKGRAGISSCTCGFAAGGVLQPGSECTNIERFPFSSYTPVVSVAQLNNIGQIISGSNSCTDGYVHNTRADICGLEKFPFASSTPVAIIGCLSSRNCDGSGQQD